MNLPDRTISWLVLDHLTEDLRARTISRLVLAHCIEGNGSGTLGSRLPSADETAVDGVPDGGGPGAIGRHDCTRNRKLMANQVAVDRANGLQ